MPKSIHHPDHPAVVASRNRALQPAKATAKKATYFVPATIRDVTNTKVSLNEDHFGLPASLKLTLFSLETRALLKKGAKISVGFNGTEVVLAKIDN